MSERELAGLRRERLRALPSVDEVLRDLDGREAVPRPRVVETIRAVLDESRRAVLAATSPEELRQLPLDGPRLRARIEARLTEAAAWQLDRVVNATGVVLHTNLGRAPLSDTALDRLAVIGRHYSNLELDVRTKERGSRYSHVDGLLCRLTGAEASLVVNNNAAAVLLALESLARGREVIVSRGELIEIGGAFRIPDIMARSGARLCEVGTTNRTRVADYAAAIGPETALLLKVHPSNYRVVGFTETVATAELVELGRTRQVPVMEDLGSGSFVDLRPWGFPHEPTAPETVAAGADLVTFSGDKLLGGPQAGLVVGRRPLVERLRKNPLNRALRIDKLTLAALEATLRAYEEPARALREIPTLRMLTEPEAAVRRRAQRILRGLPAETRAALGAGVVADRAQVGGGALPVVELPTAAVALGAAAHPAEALDARLRAGRPPVIGRIRDDRLLLDCRTVGDDEVALVIAALKALV
ncbi:MAG TPA: L-seryl-tRNA(Sec) selenium transferase [Methylomirabilota bacterium]|jgi:L-seryl-tRNA(Ser) seleniumtransferase|nr:L-seryl-tRNA(Sec) selenium transferase [Methylomirabilota bacterium]